MAKSVDAEDKKNTFDPKRVEKIVGLIESAIADRLSHKMEYVESCKSFNKAVNDAYQEGKAFGIPKKVLRAKIKERDLQRQLDGIADDFEEDDRSMFDQVSQALGEFGDTPLGNAAKDAAAKKDKGRKAPSAGKAAKAGDDEADLRGNAQKLAERDREEEANRVAAENAEKLGKGITQLN